MQVKNLCTAADKQEILDRLNKLSPQSQRQWGKMDVAQMLAHLQMPIGVSIGEQKISRSFIGKLLGGMLKKKLYNDQPFSKGLPTDRTFIMKDPKDFEKEKQKVLEMIRNFKEESIVDSPHPFFGKLTKEQWGKGMWKHVDHHLQQFGV